MACLRLCWNCMTIAISSPYLFTKRTLYIDPTFVKKMASTFNSLYRRTTIYLLSFLENFQRTESSFSFQVKLFIGENSFKTWLRKDTSYKETSSSHIYRMVSVQMPIKNCSKTVMERERERELAWVGLAVWGSHWDRGPVQPRAWLQATRSVERNAKRVLFYRCDKSRKGRNCRNGDTWIEACPWNRAIHNRRKSHCEHTCTCPAEPRSIRDFQGNCTGIHRLHDSGDSGTNWRCIWSCSWPYTLRDTRTHCPCLRNVGNGYSSELL